MGLAMLPPELLVILREQWPCREQQQRHLSALLSPTLPSPSTTVLYGPHATGKSSVLKAYLEASGLRHAIIRCQECVTGRHLLERTASAVHESLGEKSVGYNGRCENLSALAVHLQRLLGADEKFVLAFDGIDRQREAPPTLLPALARLGEIVRLIAAKSYHIIHADGQIDTQSCNRASRAAPSTTLPSHSWRATCAFSTVLAQPVFAYLVAASSANLLNDTSARRSRLRRGDTC